MAPRSYLYVPGHRPDRFDKALRSGADAVIFDLEDAVPVASKDAARDDVRAFLAGLVGAIADGPVEAWVRINDGDRGLADLAALAGISMLAGAVVPKALPSPLAALHRRAPHVPLVALVESAVAITNVTEIAGADGVRTLAMGEVDL